MSSFSFEFFAKQVAFLMRILVRKRKKHKKVAKPFVWVLHSTTEYYTYYRVLHYVLQRTKSAKPLFLPLQIFPLSKTVSKFWLLWESSMNFETAVAAAGRPTSLTTVRFVCVSVCPSLIHYENPNRSETSVRELFPNDFSRRIPKKNGRANEDYS